MRILMPLFLLMTGCTSIGVDNSDVRDSFSWQPDTEITICTLVDPDISDDKVRAIETKAIQEFQQYNIHLTFMQHDEWTHRDSSKVKILTTMDMPEGCDRLFAYLDRSVWQSLVSLAVSVEGAVDDDTGTRGYGYVKGASLSGMLLGGGENIVTHEIYHLLGCGHSMSKVDCYHQLQALKHHAPASWSFSKDAWLIEHG